MLFNFSFVWYKNLYINLSGKHFCVTSNLVYITITTKHVIFAILILFYTKSLYSCLLEQTGKL